MRALVVALFSLLVSFLLVLLYISHARGTLKRRREFIRLHEDEEDARWSPKLSLHPFDELVELYPSTFVALVSVVVFLTALVTCDWIVESLSIADVTALRLREGPPVGCAATPTLQECSQYTADIQRLPVANPLPILSRTLSLLCIDWWVVLLQWVVWWFIEQNVLVQLLSGGLFALSIHRAWVTLCRCRHGCFARVLLLVCVASDRVAPPAAAAPREHLHHVHSRSSSPARAIFESIARRRRQPVEPSR